MIEVMRMAGVMDVHRIASAKAHLKALHEHFSAWTDPLSSALHEWCEGVLLYEVSDACLSNEMWAKESREILIELESEILVNSVDRAPLVHPVYIRANGAVLEPWLASEIESLFGCYPLGKKPCEVEPHLFAEAFLAWLSPFRPFYEVPERECLSPLTEAALRDPAIRKERAASLVNHLLKTKKLALKRESALAMIQEKTVLLDRLEETKEALTALISTEMTRIQLASQQSTATFERRIQLSDATHVAERDLLQVRVDREAEKARILAEELRVAQELAAAQAKEAERLEQQAAQQRREIERLRHEAANNSGGGGGGCSIL